MTKGKYGILDTSYLSKRHKQYILKENKKKDEKKDDLIEITHSELVSLRDAGQLTLGKKYRIIDYVATTVQYNTKSANRPFDIIVTALTENTLSEDAEAALHKGDEYPFKSCLYLPLDKKDEPQPDISMYKEARYIKNINVSLAGDLIPFTMFQDDPTEYVLVLTQEEHLALVVKVDKTTIEGSVMYLNYPMEELETLMTSVIVEKSNFCYCALNKWKVKYTIDNSTNRFSWAQVHRDEQKDVRAIKAKFNDNTQYKIYKRSSENDIKHGFFQYEAYQEVNITNTDGIKLISLDGNIDYTDLVENSFIYTMGKSLTPVPDIGDDLYIIEDDPELVASVVDTMVDLPEREEGKGVIYYLCDENNNSAPFDFKGILLHPDLNVVDLDIKPESYDENAYYFFLSFLNDSTDSIIIEDYSVYKNDIIVGAENNTIEYLLYGSDIPTNIVYAINGYIHNNKFCGYGCSKNFISGSDNIISESIRITSETDCNNNTINDSANLFFGNNCSYNKINDCKLITFGGSFVFNTLDDCEVGTIDTNCDRNIFTKCSNLTVGLNCRKNTIYTCEFLTMYDACISNIVKNGRTIIFKQGCENNVCETQCANILLEQLCKGNHFGDNCSFISLGENNVGNTFGYGVSNFYFGDANTQKAYCSYNTVETGNTHIKINVSSTTSSSNVYRYVTVKSGVNTDNTYKNITDANVKQTVPTIYQPSGTIVINP